MKKGFTLIELLVVVAIITILASVVLVGFDIARARSRNATRMAGLNEIQKALNFYYNDNHDLPPDSDSGMICPECSAGINSILEEYMGGIPSDPLNDSNYHYYYDGNQTCTGRGYPNNSVAMIFVFLENETSRTAQGQPHSVCASFGGEGGSTASNAYHVILGPAAS